MKKCHEVGVMHSMVYFEKVLPLASKALEIEDADARQRNSIHNGPMNVEFGGEAGD
jgi:hypothetical protein